MEESETEEALLHSIKMTPSCSSSPDSVFLTTVVRTARSKPGFPFSGIKMSPRLMSRTSPFLYSSTIDPGTKMISRSSVAVLGENPLYQRERLNRFVGRTAGGLVLKELCFRRIEKKYIDRFIIS